MLFAGGINRRKRPHLLAEAIARLHQQAREVQLVLAGPVNDAAYLQAMRDSMRSQGCAELLLHHPFTPDVAPLYRAADVFCLPSSNEGMPNALLEAMASSLACIATNISGSADLISHAETGLLIDSDGGALDEALTSAIGPGKEAHNLGVNARRLIEQRYSAEAILDAHESLFRSISR